jgi:hypothetical protein
MTLNKIYQKKFNIIINLLLLILFSKNSYALENMTKIPNENFKENAKNVLLLAKALQSVKYYFL